RGAWRSLSEAGRQCPGRARGLFVRARPANGNIGACPSVHTSHPVRSTMTLRTVAVPLVGVVAAIGLCLAQTTGDRPRPAAGQAAAAPEEAAIKEEVAAYAAAFNKGDAAALAKFWTEDAEYVSDDGTTLKGRAAVSDRFKTLFAEKPGSTLAVTVSAV